jgi:hypothetical protein
MLADVLNAFALERNDLLKNFMSNNKVLSINDLGYNY